MSSDFLSRPIDVSRFDLIYAHAQKNLGPAGATVVIIRRALLDQAPDDLPEYLDYRAHLAAGSIYNTPPVFAIYVILLVTRWLLRDIGGLDAMAAINRAKADALYHILDESRGFYANRIAAENRSLMNVVFRLPTTAVETEFLRQAEAADFSGLGGHRSIGGIRASLYNAMTPAAVAALIDFMRHFQQRNG
jgi:phosphoserine aminotransferase